MASNLRAMASNLRAMANLLAMALTKLMGRSYEAVILTVVVLLLFSASRCAGLA